MIKYNIVLDTNIYRKCPSRADLSFQGLERLCVHGILKLHLPYIVEREYQTQQSEEYKIKLNEALSALDAIIRKGLSSTSKQKAEQLRSELRNLGAAILPEAERALTDWANSIHATRHPLTADSAIKAMESYFTGAPPLKAPKIRTDIPDAFIFQTILSLASEDCPLVVIAEDEKVASASESLENVTVFRSLVKFIESKHIQAEILDIDFSGNIDSIRKKLESFELATHEIESVIISEAPDATLWRTVHDGSIPSDDHEATISGYSCPEDIKLNFDMLMYFGKGEFGLPFTMFMTVKIHYYIFKADFHSLEFEKAPEIAPHNDYYYEATEHLDLIVAGMAKIRLEPSMAKNSDEDPIEEGIEISVDEIEGLDVLGRLNS